MNTLQAGEDGSSTKESLIYNLINRSSDGNHHDVHLFLDKYRPLIAKYINVISYDHRNHDDLQQSVLLKMWSSLKGFKRRGTGSFRKWLMAIVKSVCIDWIRKAKPSKQVQNLDPRDLAELAKANESNHADQRRKDLMTYVLNRVKLEFNPRIWQLFFAAKIEGKRAEEVAKEFATTRIAVFAASRRVIHRVQEIIDSGDFPREFAE